MWLFSYLYFWHKHYPVTVESIFFFVTASPTCLAVIVESCTFLVLPPYLKYTDQNCMLRCTTFKSIFKNLILNILLVVLSDTKDHINVFIRPFSGCKTVSSACCTEYLNLICHSSTHTQMPLQFFYWLPALLTHYSETFSDFFWILKIWTQSSLLVAYVCHIKKSPYSFSFSFLTINK